jgi:hypothetical protein
MNAIAHALEGALRSRDESGNFAEGGRGDRRDCKGATGTEKQRDRYSGAQRCILWRLAMWRLPQVGRYVRPIACAVAPVDVLPHVVAYNQAAAPRATTKIIR